MKRMQMHHFNHQNTLTTAEATKIIFVHKSQLTRRHDSLAISISIKCCQFAAADKCIINSPPV